MGKRGKRRKKQSKRISAEASKRPETKDGSPSEASTSAQTVSNIFEKGEKFTVPHGPRGLLYQFKVSMLYLCLGRGLNNFKFVIEVGEAAGKFDDLVLSYDVENGQQEKKTIYCLFQAKYAQKTETNANAITSQQLFSKSDKRQKNAYSLCKYFKSFLETLKKDERMNIEHLILYTNNDFNYAELQKEGIEIIGFASFQCQGKCILPKQNCYRFKTIPAIKRELLRGYIDRNSSKDPDSLIDEFLDLMVFAVNQPNCEEIDTAIKKELGNIFNLNVSATDAVFNAKLGQIWNSQSGKTARVMTKSLMDKYFEDYAEELRKTMFYGDTLKVEHYFKDIESITAFLQTEKCQLYISTATPNLTCVKISQSLFDLYHTRNYPEFYFAILVPANLNRENESKFRHTIESKREFVLVVKGNEDVVPSSIKSLLQSRGSECNIKVVYVSRSFDNEGDVPTFHDTCQFEGINDKHRFMDAEINLQEHKVKFSDLIEEPDFIKMKSNGSVCNEITEIDNMRIGRKLDNLETIESYYIELKFNMCVKYCKALFPKIPEKMVLVFSGITQAEVEKLLQGQRCITFEETHTDIGNHRAILLTNLARQDNDFELIRENFKSKDILWLKKDSDFFIVEQHVHNDCLTMDGLIENGVKVNLLIGEPGSGKSVALAKIMNKIKGHCGKCWTIKISLLALSSVLEELQKKDMNIESVLEFLCRVENLGKSWEKELLRHAIMNTVFCHLFFDGFDEICPQYETTVIQMLRLCKDTKANIWVTTRSQFQLKLEKELHCWSYNPIPFSEDQQRFLWRKYWQNSLGEIPNVEEAIDCMFKISENFKTSRIRSTSEFIGVPLHTIMVADICFAIHQGNDVYKYKVWENSEDVDNILAFYDAFVRAKYLVYIRDKAKLDFDISAASLLIEVAVNSFSMTHKNAAVKLLFAQELSSVIIDTEGASKIEEEIGRVGLVVKENDYFAFTHRTFAEYFVAKRLGEILTDKKRYGENSDEYKTVIDFLKDQYFAETNMMVRIFLDLMLANEKIHKAIIKDDVETVVQLIIEDERCVLEPDLLQRSPWHLAALYTKCKGNCLTRKFFLGKDHQETRIAQNYWDKESDNCTLAVLLKYPKERFSSDTEYIYCATKQFCKTDKLNFNILCYAMTPSATQFIRCQMHLLILFEADICVLKIFREFIINALQRTYHVKYHLNYLGLQTFFKFHTKSLSKSRQAFAIQFSDFWKHADFLTFVDDNSNNFKKVKALMRIAHSYFPWDSCSTKFINRILKTGSNFSELLKDTEIDLANLRRRKNFVNSKEFEKWFTSVKDTGDRESLKAVFKLFGYPTLFSLLYEPSPDFKLTFESALAMMPKNIDSQLYIIHELLRYPFLILPRRCNAYHVDDMDVLTSGLSQSDWRCSDHVKYLENLHVNGMLNDFEVLLDELNDHEKQKVLEKFDYATVIDTVIEKNRTKLKEKLLLLPIYQNYKEKIKARCFQSNVIVTNLNSVLLL